MSGISGDFGGFERFRAKLRELAAGNWRQELAERIGGEAQFLVAEEFRTATDPNGVPWLPSRRAVREGGLTLSDKSVLGNSFSAQLTPSGVTISTTDKRAATHNYGDVRTHVIRGKPRTFVFPKRQILPDREGGPWSIALEGVISDFLDDMIGGLR